MKSSKDNILNANIINIQKKASDIDSKMKSLNQIQINKKHGIKPKKQYHNKKRSSQPFDDWSPFGNIKVFLMIL